VKCELVHLNGKSVLTVSRFFLEPDDWNLALWLEERCISWDWPVRDAETLVQAMGALES
jgi:hypothetical protein